MRNQWTPGPWHVPHFAQDDVKCDCTYVLSESQRGMGAIATVHHEGEKGVSEEHSAEYEHLPTARANAHLIAAAPLLFEALDYLVALRESGGTRGGWVLAWEAAHAALAKARGEP